MLLRKLVRLFKFNYKQEQLLPKYTIKDVPYFSQWESQSLIKRIIRDEISTKDDPLWKNSGAKSPTEYEFWAKNMCGMACLKMIIDHKLNKKISIIELGKKCLKHGGYIIKEDEIDGLYYLPFVKFIKKDFNLDAEIITHMSIDDIIKELSSKNYIIASVSYKIRDPNFHPVKKGGHLILILGYDLENEKIIFHNPSGDKNVNQKYAEISFSQFDNFFAKKGIVIKN